MKCNNNNNNDDDNNHNNIYDNKINNNDNNDNDNYHVCSQDQHTAPLELPDLALDHDGGEGWVGGGLEEDEEGGEGGGEAVPLHACWAAMLSRCVTGPCQLASQALRIVDEAASQDPFIITLAEAQSLVEEAKTAGARCRVAVPQAPSPSISGGVPILHLISPRWLEKM
jgi:hypothetical protein